MRGRLRYITQLSGDIKSSDNRSNTEVNALYRPELRPIMNVNTGVTDFYATPLPV